MRVLLVDDEEAVRWVTRELLLCEGHEVREAETGAEARRLVEGDPGWADCGILDLKMAGATAAETLDALRVVRPGLPVLIWSGFDRDPDLEDVLARPDVAFLAKPFEAEALLAALRGLFERIAE